MTPEARKNGPRAPRILIVDDDPGQRSLLDSFLRGQAFDTVPVASGEEALETLRTAPFSMMISDVRMPGLSGLETLRRARQEHAVLPILLVTAYADIREAVGAMRDGALNYLAKPIDLDELLACVRQATGLAKSAPRKFKAQRQLPPQVVAESPLMQAVFDDASLIAPSESRVLITGESGVGKEVLADVIHAWSSRASGPLIKVNCAAIPESLLESELFGHEKGAFTGAHRQKPGRVEEADGGTIFLDEIADMSRPLQAKLLRFLEDGSFMRVGGTQELRVNVRLLAATNRDIIAAIGADQFREDLFHRLNVVQLRLPPVRERGEDVSLLAEHFLKTFGLSMNKNSRSISRAARQKLLSHHWPGNVRELRNVIERALILETTTEIQANSLPDFQLEARLHKSPAASRPALGESLDDIMTNFERELIAGILERNHFNLAKTAEQLKISRHALRYRMQRLDISPGTEPEEEPPTPEGKETFS